MSLNWKPHRRSGNRPYNLTLFLPIALLLHWAVFLVLETYWGRMNHTPQNRSQALLPVKFIEVPAKEPGVKASTDSSSGGEASPQLPHATGKIKARPTTSVRSSHPRLTQSNSSTPQPSQRVLPPEQPQIAPRRDSLPLTAGNTSVGPPVAQMPKFKSSSSLSQLRQHYASLLGRPELANEGSLGDGNQGLNASGLGSGSQGGGGSQRADLGPYLERLKQKVKQQWRPELAPSSVHTIIGFYVNRTGQISDLRILKHSGSTLTDQAELQAIQQAAPFGPLPEDYRAAELYVSFRFDQIQY